jgi:hypothetical protein
LGARDGASEYCLVQCFLAAEEVGGRTARDAGRLPDLLQACAFEPEAGEAVLRGDQDRLFCPFRVSGAFRGCCLFGFPFCHVRSRRDN